MRATFGSLVLVALFATLPSPARAQSATVPLGFQDELVVGGFDLPVGMAFLPDGRVLVCEQFSARIRLIANGSLAPVDPVCVVPEVRDNPGSEQGLLGIAVDPAWPARPYVYVHYDHASTAAIHIARFLVSGDLDNTGDGSLTIDPASRFLLIHDIPDDFSNHNGGTLRFGPDGMLYVSLGEDANACAAQDVASLRGKILRLRTSGLPPGSGGPPPRDSITPPGNPFLAHPSPNARLVWATGLRNPFRFWADTDGSLFVADVGQGVWEELDHLTTGGLNLGWPLREGPDPFFSSCPGVTPGPLTGPIHSYRHDSAAPDAVISGPVYRRPDCMAAGQPFPLSYTGDYFFSDYYRGFLRRLERSGSSWALAAPVAGQPSDTDWAQGLSFVSDYGIGCDGALWYCRQGSGQIRRILHDGTTEVPPVTPGVTFSPPRPSPARGGTTFDFELTRAAQVALDLYDLRGRRLRSIVAHQVRGAGIHSEPWNGRDQAGRTVPPGVYLARLRVDGRDLVQRFPLIP